MALSWNIADDLDVVDDLESITLTSTRRTGDMLDVLAKALRRAVSARERAPSNAAYQGADLMWLLKANELSADIKPKAGDKVTEADGTVWVVVETYLEARATLWRLHGLNLEVLYDLRDRVHIERPAISYDRAGAPVKAFPTGTPIGGSTPYANLLARVQLLTEEIVDDRLMRAFQGTHAVYVGRPVTVTNEDRVRWIDGGTTRYLDIVSVHNPQRIDEVVVLDAQLRA